MNIAAILQEKYTICADLAELIAQKARIKILPKSAYISFQDSQVEQVILPLKGVLAFSPTNADYAGITYNLITPGMIVNDTPYLLSTPSIAEIRATTECTFLSLTFEETDALIAAYPQFLKTLSRSVAQKQYVFHTLFHLRAEKNADLKVRRALAVLADVMEDRIVRLNILSLASLLGMSRNRVGASIKSMIANGEVIKVKGGYEIVTSLALAA
ncbi:Crp/Fnr family transcriptional regulator [Thaumasiovibrio subtropicus]|uniref:Crp/Fnr family transcriptional regulator n=1 Tax=Thaumasiovibrio subtropicus TaxID=1891207 RepID=UPI000B358E19|nr:Crp/Fnr family transcriptional regulator [Thaumasiovibrio subtropicus]